MSKAQKESRPASRIAVDDLREHASEQVRLLRTLRLQYKFNYTHLSTMRIDGAPITREHLVLADCTKLNHDVLQEPKHEPSRKLLTRSISVAHLGYLVALYDSLDPHWRTYRSIDAKHLLESWEVFVVTIKPPQFIGRKLLVLPDTTAVTDLELRLHWMTLKALMWDLISLENCENCGRPYLQAAKAVASSNWGLLPPSCPSCAHISKVRSRYGVAKPCTVLTSTKLLARPTPSGALSPGKERMES